MDKKEFDQSWFCIHQNLDESKVYPKKFRNYTRGIQFEAQVLKLFEDISVIYSHSPFIPCCVIPEKRSWSFYNDFPKEWNLEIKLFHTLNEVSIFFVF